MKKIAILSFIAMFGLLAGVFTGCSDDDDNDRTKNTITVTVNPYNNGATNSAHNPELACSFSVVGANLSIDWGDGSEPDTITTHSSAFVEHIYPRAASYKVVITGYDIRSLVVGQTMMNPEGDLYTDANATEIDLTNSPSLLKLVCDNNKSLNKILFIENSRIQQLSCNNCDLSELNIGQNIQLLAISCSDNSISALNLSKNPFLTHLDCQRNQLTSLDFGKNQRIKYVNCSYNGMNAKSLNSMMGTLPTVVSSSIYSLYIGNNPGTSGCTPNVASQKHWEVYTE